VSLVIVLHHEDERILRGQEKKKNKIKCLEEDGRIEGSQMPRHLISDAHEWINEIPTVPIYVLANPQPRERAWIFRY